MNYDNKDRALVTSKVWEKPAYEIVDLGSEVTGYMYTDKVLVDADIAPVKSTDAKVVIPGNGA
ncbi:MAG: pyrroloquinoline quinone precursor peptide PqqA [Candidatus Obscuribacterales bacterium]|nr:pyrroloquinoline quinone precursor peptide PqqA [Candidatus Obscuribacterales bacterium]